MKRSRILVALVLTLALLAAMPVSAWGAGATGNNGVITPRLWTADASYDWYDTVVIDTAEPRGRARTNLRPAK